MKWGVRRQRDSFLRATHACADTQRKVLSRLLELNSGTDFANDHGIGASSSIQQFRANVPVSDYEYHRAYIDALRDGNHSALLGERNKLLMFSMTSGTTADSKYIPVTSQFLSDYRRGWQVWGIMAFDHHPQLHLLRFAQLAGDHEVSKTRHGVPCGSISGLVAAMQKFVVRNLYSVPAIISKIEDSRARRYATLRLALPDRLVGQFVTANPSTLLQLAQFGNEHAERLIRDVHDGGLSREFDVSKGIRQRLTRKTSRPDPKRAAELERGIEQHGSLRPRDAWPYLQFLGVWTGGSAGAFLSQLKPWYGDIPFRDHGLHASEGRMTIPIEDGTPSGILDIVSHFFEFIPESEADSDSPTVLQAHEVEEGSDYYILLTTSSGLHRYNIRDVVRCTGFHNSTPLFAFLHKGAHMSNVTGEKLSESQVIEAVCTAARKKNIAIEQFTLTPVWSEPPRYQLYINAPTTDPAELESFAAVVEQELSDGNCEYHDKRASERLGRVECVAMDAAQWREFQTRRIAAQGASPEQYKHPCLIPDPEFQGRFLSFVNPKDG